MPCPKPSINQTESILPTTSMLLMSSLTSTSSIYKSWVEGEVVSLRVIGCMCNLPIIKKKNIYIYKFLNFCLMILQLVSHSWCFKSLHLSFHKYKCSRHPFHKCTWDKASQIVWQSMPLTGNSFFWYQHPLRSTLATPDNQQSVFLLHTVGLQLLREWFSSIASWQILTMCLQKLRAWEALTTVSSNMAIFLHFQIPQRVAAITRKKKYIWKNMSICGVSIHPNREPITNGILFNQITLDQNGNNRTSRVVTYIYVTWNEDKKNNCNYQKCKMSWIALPFLCSQWFRTSIIPG